MRENKKINSVGIVLLRNYVSLGFHNTVSRDVGTNNGGSIKLFMKLVTVILWKNLIANLSVSSRTI